MNCITLANVMNNTTIINTFNSDNSNIANIKSHRQQIMTIITRKFWR